MTSARKERKEHIVFVTGRLAEAGLRDLLERIAPEFGFEYTVLVLEISVAALMTPAWVARHLRGPLRADRLLLPGHCRGDHEAVRRIAGVPVERGPRDFRSLPRWFRGGGSAGESERPEGYGEYRIEIIAEINHAPGLAHEQILEAARQYRESGADVIDIGCDPGSTWNGVGDAVRRLRDEGFRVAVDSFDPREIRAAATAGAELVLSVHGKNIEVARDLGCEVVAIPDDPRTLGGLDETLARLEEWKVPHRIDPIIEPLGFGFAASLGRYIDVRRRYPGRPMMMGIGNITELLDADSLGVNVVLTGFCAELGIDSVLTTQVIPWARSSVREIDLARRLLHHAVTRKVLPKHVERDLLCLRDPEILEHGQEALDQMARKITDPNYRIFAERGELHVMNRDGYLRGRDPFELFDALGVDDGSHAFYLGYEMAKAVVALRLGKQYHQDRALRWGFLTVEEESHLERRRGREDGEPEGRAP